MLANVSFGFLVFTPIGWAFMAAVIVLEAIILVAFFGDAIGKRRLIWTSLAANSVSGLCGFFTSLGLTGGWWLVVWVPWVTANEASADHWPGLLTFMAAAYLVSVLIELGVARALLRSVSLRRILGVLLLTNLFSSAMLLCIFWSMGGIPGR